ncbi:MAG: ferredoxin [Methanocella sp. PtaU1.Bin125]|nr:MAG: ferredoxin [Methanocella sp. PtaU1.Bin125]
MSDDVKNAVRKSVEVNARVRSKPIVLTPDLARELIGNAAYVALSYRCPCRHDRQCQHFPAGFGCLFLGEGARGIVAKGNAREIDRQQALEHAGAAEELGLVHMVLWTSAELRSLGGDAKKALELCACCTCCCLDRRTGGGMKAYIDGIAGLGVARAEGECDACGGCERACPMRALTITDDGPAVNPDRCKGCGLCARACRQGVLQVYPLEMVPSFADGWQMIPARAFMDEIFRTIQKNR